MVPPKKPKVRKTPSSKKIPRHEKSAANYNVEKPTWLFESLDLDGPFGWDAIDKNELISKVLPRIKNLETMTWQEIFNDRKRNHEVELNGLSKAAKDRLIKINKDHHDSLVSLILGGKPRIWGIRSGSSLKILWWDPEHAVYPSPKKHT